MDSRDELSNENPLPSGRNLKVPNLVIMCLFAKYGFCIMDTT